MNWINYIPWNYVVLGYLVTEDLQLLLQQYPFTFHLYLHPMDPREYVHILTNRSMLSKEMTPIYLDYLQSASSS